MIFALTTNPAGLQVVAMIATLLCLVGAVIVWAQYETPKGKQKRLDYELKKKFQDSKKL